MLFYFSNVVASNDKISQPKVCKKRHENDMNYTAAIMECRDNKAVWLDFSKYVIYFSEELKQKLSNFTNKKTFACVVFFIRLWITHLARSS